MKILDRFRVWDETKGRFVYIPVRYKLVLSFIFALLWFSLSVWIAYPWLLDIQKELGAFLAWFIILGLAFIPGLVNAFIVSGLFLDNRPVYPHNELIPPVTMLMAAYNEEGNIKETIASILSQSYPAAVELIIVNDGSTDRTSQFVREMTARNANSLCTIKLIDLPRNAGKANALNQGLKQATHEYIVTLDADSSLFRNSLFNLVNYMVHSSEDTAAVAGCVLTRNSRQNWITRLQEWDYFHGIAVVKRIQSLYQGTLVAQGSFSILRKSAIEECGGWKNTMGEDIVLTWGFHSKGYKARYAENAIIFTVVPDTYGKFYRQRKRWARGLIEAFKYHPEVLVKPKMVLPLIWYNLLFPYLDFVYLAFFVPGILLAVFFQYYLIAGILTLLLLPMTFLINALMFYKQKKVFKSMGLKVRKNLLGFCFYMLAFQLFMTPACLAGYTAEFLDLRRSWGTK